MGPLTPVPATAKTFPIAARNVKEKPALALPIDGRTDHVPLDIEYSSAPLRKVFRFLPPATKMFPFDSLATPKELRAVFMLPVEVQLPVLLYQDLMAGADLPRRGNSCRR